MQNLHIVELPLGQITPYEHNPRKNSSAVDVVAKSISEFGFRVPILINEKHVILAGHTRLEAAKSLNMTTAPCIVLSHLTEAQERALRLVDNKTSEPAKWNISKLKEELAAIELTLPDAAILGMFDFDVSELENVEEIEKQHKEAVEKKPRVCTCPKCQQQFEV